MAENQYSIQSKLQGAFRACKETEAFDIKRTRILLKLKKQNLYIDWAPQPIPEFVSTPVLYSSIPCVTSVISQPL